MIALVIGGVVVFCIGLLTVVFGLPIKEFSFGNTVILAGVIVSCSGLLLIGLYLVARELRNLANRLGEGIALPAPVSASREPAPIRGQLPAIDAPLAPPPPAPRRDTLFVRDEAVAPSESVENRSPDRDEPPSGAPQDAPPMPPWQNAARTRPSVPPSAEELAAESNERPRRNIMFSSRRRGGKEDADETAVDTPPRSLGDDFRQRATQAENAFDQAWPQTSRSRPESSGGRTEQPAMAETPPEPAPRERFQPPPPRPSATPVTIVKSGVVDSMAYSLYSDGSIEAQMPEGMVRFASIEELRAHLDQRG